MSGDRTRREESKTVGIKRLSGNARWEPIVGYSRAVKAGPMIVVSGTTATEADGRIVGRGQMYTQAHQAIANIAKVLEQAGAKLSDVVRTRMFVTDISRFSDVARAHKEAFGENPPAATCVEVKALVHPDLMFEIEADAYVDEGTSGGLKRTAARTVSAPQSSAIKAAGAKTRKPAVKSKRGG
jgi:enamine deaminase RidA (YjgF/YER057c/UK114 family)